jgi:hypothetical protein
MKERIASRRERERLPFLCLLLLQRRGEEAGRGGGHVLGGGILKARQRSSFDRSYGPVRAIMLRIASSLAASLLALSSASDLDRFFSLTVQFRHI